MLSLAVTRVSIDKHLYLFSSTRIPVSFTVHIRCNTVPALRRSLKTRVRSYKIAREFPSAGMRKDEDLTGRVNVRSNVNFMLISSRWS